MKRHFDKELDSLKTTLIRMASITEEAVRSSIKAFLSGNEELALKVIGGDENINSMEIEVDNAIVDLLALRQPVAIDLRFILAAQKINNDLERIGDHAVNIAQSAITFAKHEKTMFLEELKQMGEIAETMLRDAIDGFIHGDVNIGVSVLKKDDVIDRLNMYVVQEIVGRMKNNVNSIEAGIDTIRVSRNLERIADLATNIAEEVIFIAQAKVVKHQFEIKDESTG